MQPLDRSFSHPTSRVKISGLCTPLTIVEALGRLLKKKKEDDEKIAYERFLVWKDEGVYGLIGYSYG